MSQTTADVDAATVEVIRNYLTSAATEMQRTLVRTAYNAIVYEILDFGISIYDRDLNLVADSPGLALFLGANDFGLEKAVEHVGEENLDPGDVVMMNYPYWSGTHTLDVLVFAPVFHDDEIVGYTTCRAHWLDLGAKDSGYVLDSTDVHQEGLIFPGTKVYKQGEPDEEILELIRFNSRLPDKVIGDLNAQFAALTTGKNRLQELYEKYGTETVDTAIGEVLDHGERAARSAVSDLPDGTWSAVDYADGALGSDRGPEKEDLIRLEAEVTIDGDEFTVDFSGSAEAVDEPLNIPYGMTETISKLCFKTVTTPEEDSNAGQYAPLETVAPEGNIFHATYPAPTFTIWTAILGIDVVYKALAKAIPEQIPASSGGDLLSIMVYGENPETGQQFVEANNEGVGWGGAPDHDGANALMHISESMVQNVPVEVYENKAPLEIDRLELRQDSGGAGEYRGGLGIQRDYTFTHPVGALSIIQKTKTDNWGLDGGNPGARNAVVLHPDTDREEWTGMMRETFAAGEGLSNRSGGGAGRGDPHDRDPAKVREDVLDGYVSREAAREEYGVAITDDGEIDEDETESLRS
jgi:N-methylhydantoinase B